MASPGSLAVEDAALRITSSLAPQTTICFGTAASGVGDIAESTMDALRVGGPKSVQPWSALEFPSHTASSYLAIEFGIVLAAWATPFAGVFGGDAASGWLWIGVGAVTIVAALLPRRTVSPRAATTADLEGPL